MLASALAPALAQQWSADESPLNVATVTALQPEAGPSRPPPTELPVWLPPVFDSKAALEQNAVWSRYFLATYGELPDPTSYPLHITDLDTLYVDRLPPGFFDAMDKRFIPSEDGGSLSLDKTAELQSLETATALAIGRSSADHPVPLVPANGTATALANGTAQWSWTPTALRATYGGREDLCPSRPGQLYHNGYDVEPKRMYDIWHEPALQDTPEARAAYAKHETQEHGHAATFWRSARAAARHTLADGASHPHPVPALSAPHLALALSWWWSRRVGHVRAGAQPQPH